MRTRLGRLVARLLAVPRQLLFGGVAGGQKTHQVPARRRLGQAFVPQRRIPGPRADEVDPQGIAQVAAHGLVAFRIGREVSVTELGTQLGMNKNTVDRYLDLLEKACVVYSRQGFNRNLRKEITKSRRYYFYDNGIRNGLISNFNALSLRDDAGALWENYILVERLKNNLYTGRLAESYFWRTYDRQEIDLVEEWGGRLYAAEMKWSPRSAARAPGGWRQAYPDSAFRVVHRENYLDFITASAS